MPARRFIADEHLLRLARWLRAAGEDVLYLSPVEDRRLVEIARAEGRVILTRDRRLALEAGPEHAYRVEAEDPSGQLAEFFRIFPGDPLRNSFTRCLLCNAPLERVSREEVAGALPPEVAARHDDFRRCPRCLKVFWPGSHYRRLRAGLERIRGGGRTEL